MAINATARLAHLASVIAEYHSIVESLEVQLEKAKEQIAELQQQNKEEDSPSTR